MTKQMVKENIRKFLESYMMGFGLMISLKARGYNSWLMDLSMMENFAKAPNMVTEFINGLIALFIRENGKTMNLMVWVIILGQITEDM